MSTQEPIVPLGADDLVEPAPRRRGCLGVGFAILGLVVLAGLVGSLFVRIDRVALKPGSARPTSELVTVDGAPTFASQGNFAFTTVALVDRITIFDWVQDHFDDDIDTYERKQIFTGSPEENRALNAQQMVGSKQVAIKVALEFLGYDVPLTFDGMEVLEVEPGLPADGTLVKGDTITVLNGEQIDEDGEFQRLLDPLHPGDHVTLTVESPDGESRTVDLTLGVLPDQPDHPADPDQGAIGILPQPHDVTINPPFDVAIDSGDVGGPSAGLAFTLSVIDALTPGDLTGGRKVAVTGEILADGSVGLVGGVKQKSAAVASAGYEVFLVPKDEVSEAEERLGDAVRVIGVGTLQDALDALVALGGTGLTTDAAG